jgi:AraC-like DNA-binding protein
VGSRGQRFVGDSIEAFDAGDLVLVGSNLPHYWRNYSEARDSSEFAHSLVIQFYEDFLGERFLAAPELRPVARLLKRAGRGICFAGDTGKRVAEEIHRMGSLDGVARLAALIGVLNDLAASREGRYLSTPRFAPNLDHQASERISRCHRYVFGNLGTGIHLEDAARAAGMSPGAFCRYFRRVTGKTFFNFVNEIRTGHACRLLIETDGSVTDICYASGFSSVSNFNRRFRERLGVSPRDYRKAHLQA